MLTSRLSFPFWTESVFNLSSSKRSLLRGIPRLWEPLPWTQAYSPERSARLGRLHQLGPFFPPWTWP